MNEAIALLQQLGEDGVEWVLDTAVERSVPQGEELIAAGEALDALYLVMQGLLAVVADEEGTQLAVLGAGELVGEMSLVSASPPTESVRALEDTTVLVLPHAAISDRSAQHPTFAAELHAALARLLAGRLRAANRRLRVSTADVTIAAGQHPAWARLEGALEELKKELQAANEAAPQLDDELPEEVAASAVTGFLDFCELLNRVVNDEVDNERVRDEIGLRVQRELLPYILLAGTAERFYRKPRGYAGDFYTIELLYRNEPAGDSPLGRLVDRCFLESPAARAVRNRRPLLAEVINESLAQRAGSTVHITSLACGPAREVFDVFDGLDDPAALHATLLDIDLHALAFVGDVAKQRGLRRQLTLESGNVIHLALGRAHTDIADQDIVYSIGLTDYFSDDLVVNMLNLVHRMLRPGGRVVLGNVHPYNPSRGMLDYILDWKLIHRTQDDFDRLFAASAFGRPSTRVQFEEQGLNMFAECVR